MNQEDNNNAYKQQFEQLVNEIVNFLEGYHVDKSYADGPSSITTLKGPDSESIYIRKDRERLRFTGIYHRDQRGNFHATGMSDSITVSASREPKSIAADVTRRLLPDYRTNLAKVLKSIERAHQDFEKSERIYAELAKLLNVVAQSQSHGRSRILYNDFGSTAHARIEVREDGYVTMKIDTNHEETAIKIVKTLTEIDASSKKSE